jgi:hypothetical protein
MARMIGVTASALHQALGRSNGDESLEPGDADTLRVRAELDAALRRLARAPEGEVFLSLDDRWVSLAQTFLAREGEALGGRRVPGAAGGDEAQFDGLDPGWLRFLVIWARSHPKAAFPALPAVAPIPADARLALLADWGTGLYGAPVCAASIARTTPAPHAVIHLGDIYYAGADDEVQQRFLDHWPTVPGARNFALNGNHEMYTGGGAYFDKLLGDPRFRQPSSCFALRNEDWLLVGLDTAYDEHALHGGQADWLNALADDHPGHRLMLFSHHQPFSAFEKQGPMLVAKLWKLLGSGRIAAWYWGHEHLCARYDLHEGWKMHGRCIGHGGFPYYRVLPTEIPDGTRWAAFASRNYVPGGVVLDGPNPHVPGHEDAYGPNGYVMVELQGRAVHETYHAADGAVLAEFDIPAA